jgi:hypothetical protein
MEKTSEYWLKLAEEARLRAAKLKDAEFNREMYAIAQGYERMAEYARRMGV